MPWVIEWSNGATRDLVKLDNPTAKRIVLKLEEVAKAPERYFKRLKGFEDFKLRIGDYRVLVLLIHSKQTVFVERLDHRKNVYKKKK